MSRSPADEAARYRLEVQALQRENADLKRSRTIVEGVPVNEHKRLQDEAESLRERLEAAAGTQKKLKARLSERDSRSDGWRDAAQKMARHVTEAKRMESENARLVSENERLRRTVSEMKRAGEQKAHALQCEIDELKCRLRHDD